MMICKRSAPLGAFRRASVPIMSRSARRRVLERTTAEPSTADLEEQARLEKADAFEELKQLNKSSQSVNRPQKAS